MVERDRSGGVWCRHARSLGSRSKPHKTFTEDVSNLPEVAAARQEIEAADNIVFLDSRSTLKIYNYLRQKECHRKKRGMCLGWPECRPKIRVLFNRNLRSVSRRACVRGGCYQLTWLACTGMHARIASPDRLPRRGVRADNRDKVQPHGARFAGFASLPPACVAPMAYLVATCGETGYSKNRRAPLT